MRFVVHVKPGSHHDAVEDLGNNTYNVRLRARAKDGEANDALLQVLAHHFACAPSCLKLLRGKKSRVKHLLRSI